MGYQQIIAVYVNALNEESGRRLARKYGVDFTLAEAQIILPFLKQHRYELDIEHKNILLHEGSYLVSAETLKKVEYLLDQFI